MHRYHPLDDSLSKAFTVAVFSALFASLYWLIAKPKSSTHIPRIGKDPGVFGLAKSRADFLKNGHSLIQEGYRKYGDSAFCVQTADMERVVVSRRFVPELRSLPEEVLSLRKAMSERHLGSYTSLNIIQLSHLQNEVCRNQLQTHLSVLMEGIREEMRYGISQSLDKCDGKWQGANVYQLVLDSVARAVSRSFVGYPLCRDGTWLDTTIGYTGAVFAVSQDLRNRHWLTRPAIYPFLNSRKRLRNYLDTARGYLVPLLEARTRVSPNKTPDDLLKWMMESAKGADKSPYRLSDKIMFLCLASIHTSTSTAVHIIYDLCQYSTTAIGPLKEEILGATAEHGGFTLAALNKMKKLDSFMKESQRVNHPGTMAFNRKVVKSITLSNGTILLSNTFISTPSAAIANDPNYYPHPETFDPWRFSDLRDSSAAAANKYQFAGTNDESLPFGMGKFACPGRFFAAGMIKQLLALLILEYDFRFPGEQKERPPNAYLDERIIPSTKQLMEFRRKKQVTVVG